MIWMQEAKVSVSTSEGPVSLQVNMLAIKPANMVWLHLKELKTSDIQGKQSFLLILNFLYKKSAKVTLFSVKFCCSEYKFVVKYNRSYIF